LTGLLDYLVLELKMTALSRTSNLVPHTMGQRSLTV